MKKILSQLSILFAIILLFFNFSCNRTMVDISNVVEAVKACSDSLVKAEAALDVEGALMFYAEDAIIQPAGAPQIRGHESIARMYRQFFEDSQLKEFYAKGSHITVSQSGDLAYEIGVNRTILTGPQGDLLSNGKYLIVWKKIDGEWLVVVLTFSDDAPEPNFFSPE